MSPDAGHPGHRKHTEEIMALVSGETETPLARLDRKLTECRERERKDAAALHWLLGYLKKSGRRDLHRRLTDNHAILSAEARHVLDRLEATMDRLDR